MSARDTNFRNPNRVRLTIACVYLSNYFKNDDQGVVAKAIDMLDEHNLELDVWPDYGKKYVYNTLPYSNLVPHDDNAYKALRDAVDKKIRQGGCTFVIPLPIVFCQFQHWGHGLMPLAMKKGLTHACLISTNVNDDKVTLLHEMGHAADLHHENGQSNRGNFMHEADPRSLMYRFQVEKMARAVYSVG